MKTVSIIQIIVGMTIIALAEIAVVGSALLPLVQSVSATTDVITGTTVGEEGGAVSTTTNTNNNVSNAVLGSLFLIGEHETTGFNPINETYFVISYEGNVTIMPPNATTTINATETANVTVNILPNGLDSVIRQSLIVIEGDDGAAAEQEENATSTVVEISRTNPDGTGNATGAAFFSTNSTGQLAFLNNMLAIAQVQFSPEGDRVKMWEWKGGTLSFETGAGAAPTEEPSPLTDTTTTTTTNATATTTADDTNGATTPAAPASEQGEGEEQQQQQTTIAPNPLFE